MLRPTLAGTVAFAVFAAISITIHALPSSFFTEGDSPRLRLSAIQDLTLMITEPPAPRLMVFGTSRLVPIVAEDLASACTLNPNEVLNMSRPGNDYFYIAAFVRKHPELFENLEMLIIDIMPFQIMISPNFPEQGAYFLRHSTAKLRFKVKDWPKRLEALSDLVVPAWSRSQTPFFWKTGYERQSTPEDEILMSIHDRPESELPTHKNLLAELAKAIESGNLHEATANLFFFNTEISDIQIASLHALRKSLPENCEIVLVSLPVNQKVTDFIRTSTSLTEGTEALAHVMEDLEEPAFHQRWFETPEDLGLDDTSYTNDEIHFSYSGSKIITQVLANIHKDMDQDMTQPEAH